MIVLSANSWNYLSHRDSMVLVFLFSIYMGAMQSRLYVIFPQSTVLPAFFRTTGESIPRKYTYEMGSRGPVD